MCNLTQYDTKLQRMICILLPNAKALRKYPTLIISPFRINDTSVMLYLLLILVYSKVSKVLNSYLSWFPYLSPSTSFMITFTSIIFYLLSFNLSFILPKNWILFAFYTYIILIFYLQLLTKSWWYNTCKSNLIELGLPTSVICFFIWIKFKIWNGMVHNLKIKFAKEQVNDQSLEFNLSL